MIGFIDLLTGKTIYLKNNVTTELVWTEHGIGLDVNGTEITEMWSDKDGITIIDKEDNRYLTKNIEID